jgi:hypothetical protein
MIRTLKTSSKRKQMMKYFWNKIKINQPLPEKKQKWLKITEFKSLKRVYDKISENLKVFSFLEKEQSIKNISPSISILSIDLQMMLTDIFEDFKIDFEKQELALTHQAGIDLID